ncbi:hypothetical protein [Amycolatopsis sp. CA-128772]|uniref:hypothetical protein n=1 Tax=Amycolatopsis sp. CA-128772 TaxID=2073159 RepID=UPI001304DCD3|nr:hypothetical protein [Amycolatopsis sp. CA-128772]
MAMYWKVNTDERPIARPILGPGRGSRVRRARLPRTTSCPLRSHGARQPSRDGAITGAPVASRIADTLTPGAGPRRRRQPHRHTAEWYDFFLDGSAERRGFWAGRPQAGVPVGNLLATAVLAILAATMDNATFLSDLTHDQSRNPVIRAHDRT